MIYVLKNFFTLRPRRLAVVPRGVNVAQMFGIFFAQLLDFATTVVGLKIGAMEQNGVMAMLINTYGAETFLAIKLVAAAFLTWVAWRRPVFAWVVSLVYFAVALWNLSVIYRTIELIQSIQL
jgi:hypothetical protein